METHGTTIEEHQTMTAIQCINQKMPEVELRDLFAMSSMNALIRVRHTDYEMTEDDFAKLSYQYADAMVKARSKK